MLAELILREERRENFSLLVLLGGFSVLLGFVIARLAFPSQADLLTVFFAAIPMIYPLVDRFLEDEEKNAPHLDEIKIYGSIFVGVAFSFFLLGVATPYSFEIQVSQFSAQLSGFGIETATGATGYATQSVGFQKILWNNLFVFSLILATSTLITSAGVFILAWNASVLGIFLGVLVRNLPDLEAVLAGQGRIPPPWAYLPHATFEIGGFIVAGVSGSLMSAAVYRRHFNLETWKDYISMVLSGIGLIVLAAALETGRPLILLFSGVVTSLVVYYGWRQPE